MWRGLSAFLLLVALVGGGFLLGSAFTAGKYKLIANRSKPIVRKALRWVEAERLGLDMEAHRHLNDLRDQVNALDQKAKDRYLDVNTEKG